MIEATRSPKRHAGSGVRRLAPVLLVAAWGIAWIACHASEQATVHILFQSLALAESVIALLLRWRKPVGAVVGILIAYVAFQLDPLLLPPLLVALFTVAAVTERRGALIATAATAGAVVLLPLTGRASIDLAGYLLPRLLAIAATAGLGLWVHPRAGRERA